MQDNESVAVSASSLIKEAESQPPEFRQGKEIQDTVIQDTGTVGTGTFLGNFTAPVMVIIDGLLLRKSIYLCFCNKTSKKYFELGKV